MSLFTTPIRATCPAHLILQLIHTNIVCPLRRNIYSIELRYYDRNWWKNEDIVAGNFRVFEIDPRLEVLRKAQKSEFRNKLFQERRCSALGLHFVIQCYS